jgi:cytochrome c biogenesis protein CcmG/thiol:disulfide interchange protein DsbE
MIRFGIPVVLFAALAALLLAGLGNDPKKVPSPLIGKPAPSFDLPLLGDESQRLRTSDLLGQVWVLNVWGSWCPACIDEHASVTALAKSGVAPVYGLNWKDQPENASAWLKRFGNPYTAVLSDLSGSTGIDWGVYGAPETFLIDPQGKIRYKHIGPLTPQNLENEILPRLAALNEGAEE